MLQDDELRLLLRICRDHEVVYCPTCDKTYKLFDLGSDLIGGRRFNQCPSCGWSTDDALRAHLIVCPGTLAEEAAGRAEVIQKVTRTLVDQSRVTIAESHERSQRNFRRPG